MAVVNEPNLFELQGGNIKVTYSTSGIIGQPQFSFKRGRTVLNFGGNQIRSEKAAIGTLVTVTIETVPDLRTVLFSLMLPIVNLQQASKVNLKTIGILTTEKTSIGGPGLVKGALQSYKVIVLAGTAKSVVF